MMKDVPEELMEATPEEVEVEDDDQEVMAIQWRKWREKQPWPRKSGGGVMLEGYVDNGREEGSDGFARTKSLADEDLEELKGCLNLGFGFSYEEIPELCNTLPALELCYSMSQRFLDEQQQQSRPLDRSSSGASMDMCESLASPPISNWRISSPGDDPDEVKARLKYWAQAVTCTIKIMQLMRFLHLFECSGDRKNQSIESQMPSFCLAE